MANLLHLTQEVCIPSLLLKLLIQLQSQETPLLLMHSHLSPKEEDSARLISQSSKISKKVQYQAVSTYNQKNLKRKTQLLRL